MGNQNEKPRTVGELENFPFKTFAELKTKVNEGVVHIGVDRGVALQWIQNGIYSTSWQRIRGLIMASMIFLVPIGLLVYVVVTQSWWLLLSLPFLFIAYFMLHPSSGALFGPLRTLLVWFTFCGLAWGFINEVPWLTAITICLAVLWYSQKSVYGKAVDGMISAALKHEDLLCILWSNNSLNISLYNGNSYWNKMKQENGQITHYELDKA